MPTKKPQALITMTEEMNAEINRIVLMLDTTKSEYLRRAIRNQIIADGGTITETMPARGTYDRNK